MSVNKEKLGQLMIHLATNPKVTNLGLTKLYKLVFFCDVTHLRGEGKSITGSEYIKYEHGPVPSRGESTLKKLSIDSKIAMNREVLDARNDVRIQRISSKAVADMSKFSKEELETIAQVVESFGARTAKELSDISHSEPAWIEAAMQDKLDPQLMMYGCEEDPEDL